MGKLRGVSTRDRGEGGLEYSVDIVIHGLCGRGRKETKGVCVVRRGRLTRKCVKVVSRRGPARNQLDCRLVA